MWEQSVGFHMKLQVSSGSLSDGNRELVPHIQILQTHMPPRWSVPFVDADNAKMPHSASSLPETFYKLKKRERKRKKWSDVWFISQIDDSDAKYNDCKMIIWRKSGNSNNMLKDLSLQFLSWLKFQDCRMFDTLLFSEQHVCYWQ